MNLHLRMQRRAFLRSTFKFAAVAPFFLNSHLLGSDSAASKLNIACIGLGGQMQGLMRRLVELQENIVALCDVDANRILETRKAFGPAVSKANSYSDFRKLLEREKSLDAVVIATPDHWHAKICTASIQGGKHVYCEKPLTHTVAEARHLGSLASQSKVITQTGNQGSGSTNFRRSIELIQAGVLGSVSEVHIWHPPHGWPSGVERPVGADPIPDGLNWNFWLGPAPTRAFKQSVYHPAQWRGWYDFGGGSLADFCCHAFSMPVRALDLDYPNRIEVSGVPVERESFPKSCRVRFNFPARGGRGPISINFYTGDEKPNHEVTAGMAATFDQVPNTGCLVMGDKGTLSAGLWNNECRLKMKEETSFGGTNHDAARSVPQTLPRARGDHMQEWIDACKGGPKTFSPFEIGAHVTEIGASGLVALRLGRNIDWDGLTMQAKGEPGSAHFVQPQERNDWAG